MPESTTEKRTGAFYTPESVAASLVAWAKASGKTRMLDPGCGTGNFLIHHQHFVGIEANPDSASEARRRAPGALVHTGNFFHWVENTRERFDAVVGNPPFIRYQHFAGDLRHSAQKACSKLGVDVSGLASSWAPYLIAATQILRPGSRLSFVVPAEIGHSTYSVPLLQFLLKAFGHLQIVCIRTKFFEDLNEDCWLLYASHFGEESRSLNLTFLESFAFHPSPPPVHERVSIEELELWNYRLRPFFMSKSARDAYRFLTKNNSAIRFDEVARINIGYVTGDNKFFHLRKSEAEALDIPWKYLQPSVRKGEYLKSQVLTDRDVNYWIEKDLPVLLLNLPKTGSLPKAINEYLSTERAKKARLTYKCQNRSPWYAVPDVVKPDGFLTYMASETPTLVRNDANCSCTNSVHYVRMKTQTSFTEIQRLWGNTVTALSCELEGHPLGGGLLKVEPKEAGRLLLAEEENLSRDVKSALSLGLIQIRAWRSNFFESGKTEQCH